MNLEMIAKKLEFDLEDVVMLMEMFLENAKESLEGCDEAISANNFQEIKNIAHAIKGSASNLTLDDLSNSALKIEELAKNETEADYRSLFDELRSKLIELEELRATV